VAAADAGRDSAGLTRALFVTVRIDADVATGREVLERYARANYGLSLTELEAIQAVVTGTADQVARRLADYVAAGARHLVARIGALDLTSHHEQLEQLAELPTPLLLPALPTPLPLPALPTPLHTPALHPFQGRRGGAGPSGATSARRGGPGVPGVDA